MIQTSSPNSDPSFGNIDYPISSPSGSKHPLLFVPIVCNNKVAGIIRFFWYPIPPIRFQLSSAVL